MPFDGYELSLVHLFDEMLWFFGPNGERWAQGTQIDGMGNRCLVGALLLLLRKTPRKVPLV